MRAAAATLDRLVGAAGLARAATLRRATFAPVTTAGGTTKLPRPLADPRRWPAATGGASAYVAGLAPPAQGAGFQAPRHVTAAGASDAPVRRIAAMLAQTRDSLSLAALFAPGYAAALVSQHYPISEASLTSAPAPALHGSTGALVASARPKHEGSASLRDAAGHWLRARHRTLARLATLANLAGVNGARVVAGRRLRAASEVATLAATARLESGEYRLATGALLLCDGGQAMLTPPSSPYRRNLSRLAGGNYAAATPSMIVSLEGLARLAHSSQDARLGRNARYFAPNLRTDLPTRRLGSDRFDRAASHPGAAPALSTAPATINVAINLHGVVNGDEFVRRHGYAIAQVLDQAMERRARRTF